MFQAATLCCALFPLASFTSNQLLTQSYQYICLHVMRQRVDANKKIDMQGSVHLVVPMQDAANPLRNPCPKSSIADCGGVFHHNDTRCISTSHCTHHGARARHDLGGLSLVTDLAEAGPLSKLLAGVHLGKAKNNEPERKIWHMFVRCISCPASGSLIDCHVRRSTVSGRLTHRPTQKQTQKKTAPMKTTQHYAWSYQALNPQL